MDDPQASDPLTVTDVFDPTKRSAVMAAVKGRGTGPERWVQERLRSLHVRPRLNDADLPGRPDLSFAGAKVAIFVNGCFWHGHDCARGSRIPSVNRTYWLEKIERNRRRDRRSVRSLRSAGWSVCIIWECRIAAGAQRAIRMLETNIAKRARKRGRPRVGAKVAR